MLDTCRCLLVVVAWLVGNGERQAGRLGLSSVYYRYISRTERRTTWTICGWLYFGQDQLASGFSLWGWVSSSGASPKQRARKSSVINPPGASHPASPFLLQLEAIGGHTDFPYAFRAGKHSEARKENGCVTNVVQGAAQPARAADLVPLDRALASAAYVER